MLATYRRSLYNHSNENTCGLCSFLHTWMSPINLDVLDDILSHFETHRIADEYGKAWHGEAVCVCFVATITSLQFKIIGNFECYHQFRVFSSNFLIFVLFFSVRFSLIVEFKRLNANCIVDTIVHHQTVNKCDGKCILIKIMLVKVKIWATIVFLEVKKKNTKQITLIIRCALRATAIRSTTECIFAKEDGMHISRRLSCG